MSAIISHTTSIDRETIYHKLQLLSVVVSLMEKSDGTFDNDDFFAMSMLISDVSREIYPEWKPSEE